MTGEYGAMDGMVERGGMELEKGKGWSRIEQHDRTAANGMYYSTWNVLQRPVASRGTVAVRKKFTDLKK